MAKNELLPKKNNQPAKKKLDLSTSGLKALQKAVTKIELPRLFNQLIIFVLDASNSMNSQTERFNSRAEEVHDVISRVLTRLQESKNATSFDICTYAFSDEFTLALDVKPLSQIDSNQSFNPFDLIAEPRGTRLEACLSDVEKTIDDYFTKHQDKNHQALVILLSDGAIDDHEAALEQAQRLMDTPKVTLTSIYMKRFVDPDSVYYSWKEASGKIDKNRTWTTDEVLAFDERTAELFKDFASDGAHYEASVNPDDIRNQMIKSISLVSKLLDSPSQ